MEVTFASGLEGLGKKVLAKRAQQGGETLFQQYLQRSTERRKAARAQRRGKGSGSESDEQGAGAQDGGKQEAFFDDEGAERKGSDIGFDDDFFQVCWRALQRICVLCGSAVQEAAGLQMLSMGLAHTTAACSWDRINVTVGLV
jgi:hypothetical protein